VGIWMVGKMMVREEEGWLDKEEGWLERVD
jgi:hypothetical protein